jgi:hypothetical protein
VTRKVSREASDAWVDMYEGVFFALMQGIVKATSIEEEYAHLESDARHLTQQEMHRIARVAAEHYVRIADPLMESTKEQCDKWKREAIEYALRKRK